MAREFHWVKIAQAVLIMTTEARLGAKHNGVNPKKYDNDG
jgi:hypothetical protein